MAASSSTSASGIMTTHIVRLHPGMEIYSSLQRYVEDNKLEAAFVVTAVGSVTGATLRFANTEKGNLIKTLHGQREIVSLVGTISAGSHLHISLSDAEGNVVGGHVMGDLLVFTTCEVVIGNTEGLRMVRPFDKSTGFPELALESLP